MIEFTLDNDVLKELQELEKRLFGTRHKLRARLLKRVAKQVIKNSQMRTRQQIDVAGQRYAEHNKNRKRKMLTRLARRLKITSFQDEGVIVGFKNPVNARIGAEQQFGYTHKISSSKLSKATPENADDPATRTQARALIDEGFKARPNGRSWSTPTIKWIVANLSIGKAGIILRAMRGKKEFWQTVLPKRSFLGVSDEEMSELVTLMIDETSTALTLDGIK